VKTDDSPGSEQPFMEHPSGEFDTAIEAMADAIKRLRILPNWDTWMTLGAQGTGGRVDSYHCADIRMRQGEIGFESSPQLGQPVKPISIDIGLVTKRAGVAASALAKIEGGYSVADATPLEAARIMDVIFREYLGIRPHTGKGDDYAVGAEW
jgi:hypothetical protein